MPPARRWVTLAAIVSLLGGCHAATRPGEPARSALGDLVRDYDRETAPYHPFTASEAGLRQYDRVLANDIGPDYRRGMLELCTRYREALGRLDAARLGDGERVTYDAFLYRVTSCVEGYRFPWHLLPVNQVGFAWPSRFPMIGAGRGQHPFKTARNYEDFLGRVDGFVVWMDTAIANMRDGAERGVTPPRVLMERVLPQLDAQIVDDPEKSSFYEPLRNFPAAVDAAARLRLTPRYVDAIRNKIVPAYRRLHVFIATEYLPRCRTTDGFGALPDGRAWYAQAVRNATTTMLTPEEIHEIGLAEVTRLRAAISALRAEITAAGEAPPARHQTLDELLQGYARLRTDVDRALPRLFGRLPKAGFEIRPIEAFRERSMPSSYEASSPDGSRAGVFYLNTSELRTRGNAGVYRSLFLHEAVPGHHLQIALQRENAGLPGFRRFGSYVAFVEGWALYAEGLGVELEVYPSRWDRLGMLNAELFRAHRLVVDTGLHAKGWTREQAMDYLGGATPGTQLEVERYMAWPGQALGYKIGQLKILSLRRKAEAALGPAFDVRAFHDELLRDGALPLDVLEAKMERWISRRGP
jgi:uncharacterized protein (DUF885 family)